MGAVSALLLAAAFAAAPAPDAFRFDGPSASATVDGAPAALRVGEEVREGTGSAFLRGQDRVRGRGMTYGDAGELWVRIRSGDEVYRVELDAVGFPPETALPKETARRRGWWLKREAAPRPPEGGVEGGVVLGRVVNGGSGLGVRDMPARQAAVALWGIGRLYRNDELVAPRARILAQVVPGGAVSREGALRAQEPRRELDVFVDELPAEASQAGYVHFVLEGASIAEPPAAVARRETPPPPLRQETREERLSRRPTTEELWDSGASMIVWRDERAAEGAAGGAPAAGGGTAGGPAGAAAQSGTAQAAGAGAAGAGAYGAAAEAPAGAAAQSGTAQAPGAGAAGVTASGAAPAPGALAYNPWVTPGTQTVIQPPPPLLAVPATPNTAPIQYETGQNGGTIGIGMIGGGGTGAVYGGSGFATGVFNNATPAPSGVFSGMNPTSAPTLASPATPPVPNPAAPAVPSGGPTVLPPTPQPLNAQPAPIPGATAPVPTQLPAQTQPTPPIGSQSTPASQAVSPGMPAPSATTP